MRLPRLHGACDRLASSSCSWQPARCVSLVLSLLLHWFALLVELYELHERLGNSRIQRPGRLSSCPFTVSLLHVQRRPTVSRRHFLLLSSLPRLLLFFPFFYCFRFFYVLRLSWSHRAPSCLALGVLHPLEYAASGPRSNAASRSPPPGHHLFSATRHVGPLSLKPNRKRANEAPDLSAREGGYGACTVAWLA